MERVVSIGLGLCLAACGGAGGASSDPATAATPVVSAGTSTTGFDYTQLAAGLNSMRVMMAFGAATAAASDGTTGQYNKVGITLPCSSAGTTTTASQGNGSVYAILNGCVVDTFPELVMNGGAVNSTDITGFGGLTLAGRVMGLPIQAAITKGRSSAGIKPNATVRSFSASMHSGADATLGGASHYVFTDATFSGVIETTTSGGPEYFGDYIGEFTYGGLSYAVIVTSNLTWNSARGPIGGTVRINSAPGAAAKSVANDYTFKADGTITSTSASGPTYTTTWGSSDMQFAMSRTAQ